VRAAMIQMDIAWESKEANFARAGEFVKKASEERRDIVIRFRKIFCSRLLEIGTMNR